MPDTELLDRGYAAVMQRIVTAAEAPHFTELAAELGIGLAEARELLHQLVAVTPGWMHPGTDYLASFPPFNLQPTHYKVSVDGARRWYAQCAFEATAVRWLFPGRTVRVDAPCLCCGEPIVIEARDELLSRVEPAETVGYSPVEVGGDPASRPFR
jgi:hypothetical protein